jgi:hypothetical protein
MGIFTREMKINDGETWVVVNSINAGQDVAGNLKMNRDVAEFTIYSGATVTKLRLNKDQFLQIKGMVNDVVEEVFGDET